MQIADATLEGISPYSQSRAHFTPKKEKENHEDYEARTWRERQHYDKDGRVYIPPMAFKNCLAEAAKYLAIQIPGKGKSTYTKHFEAGVMVTDALVLPVNKDETEGEWLFVPASGVRGDGKRVRKCFPFVREWGGMVRFYILDDTITRDVFEKVLTQAGQFIGIGRFRPKSNGFYGRFAVKTVKWSQG